MKNANGENSTYKRYTTVVHPHMCPYGTIPCTRSSAMCPWFLATCRCKPQGGLLVSFSSCSFSVGEHSQLSPLQAMQYVVAHFALREIEVFWLVSKGQCSSICNSKEATVGSPRLHLDMHLHRVGSSVSKCFAI